MRWKVPAFVWVVASVALLRSPGSYAGVWQTRETWSAEWENRYAEWVSANWSENFFVREGTPYTRLRLDCADVVYSMRVVFSAEHGLPFAMKDPTGGSRPLTNEMSRWDAIPEESQRVRRFLQLIYGIAGTSTLPSDTYPVAVTRDAIRSGGLILTDKKNHHSWTIQRITDEGIPHLVYSSRPAKAQIKHKFGFPTEGFIFPNGLRASRHAGFRAFREIGDIGRPVWEASGYSEEQYQIPLRGWRREVQRRIAIRIETHEQRLTRLLADVCQAATERVTIVIEALAFLSGPAVGRCLDAMEYDDHSTPSRDERMRGSFEDLVMAFQDATPERATVSAETWARAVNVLQSTRAEFCPVEIAPGRVLSLGTIRSRSMGRTLSDNPHDSLAHRWGESSGRSPLARRCPTFD